MKNETNKERWERERKEWVSGSKDDRRRIYKRQWARRRREVERDPYVTVPLTKPDFAEFEMRRKQSKLGLSRARFGQWLIRFALQEITEIEANRRREAAAAAGNGS